MEFSGGWPLNSDAFEDQMSFLAERGFRCIAHDRRGHGRSSQPLNGNGMDTYTGDLARLTESLDLILGRAGSEHRDLWSDHGYRAAAAKRLLDTV